MDRSSFTPKAFDTLTLLVRNAGRLVEKDELLSTLWSDSFVEEGSLTNNISVLRKAVGEDVAFMRNSASARIPFYRTGATITGR